MNLEEIVAPVSDKFEVAAKYRKLGLEFLTTRLHWLEQSNTYNALTEAIVRDELQLFYYMRGAIPISTGGGNSERIRFAADLYLFRPFQLGILGKEMRNDIELFRLYRRISERGRKGIDPSWGELMDQFGQTELLRSYFHRTVTYDDILPQRPRIALVRYMSGETKVTLSNGRKKSISSIEDLHFLGILEIYRRGDTRLIRLYKRVKRDHAEKNGQDWLELINSAGTDRRIIANLGRIVVSGDVTKKYTLKEDMRLLKGYLTAIPLIGENDHMRPIANIFDLHIFSEAYNNPGIKRQDPNLLDQIFRRISSRAWRNGEPSAREVVDKLFSTALVRDRFGRTFTSRDIDMIATLNKYLDLLESYMTGDGPIFVSGLEKTINSIPDMRFLISHSRTFYVPQVVTIVTLANRYHQNLGIRYYDLLEISGARPRVVEKYGRPITRADANPMLMAA